MSNKYIFANQTKQIINIAAVTTLTAQQFTSCTLNQGILSFAGGAYNVTMPTASVFAATVRQQQGNMSVGDVYYIDFITAASATPTFLGATGFTVVAVATSGAGFGGQLLIICSNSTLGFETFDVYLR